MESGKLTILGGKPLVEDHTTLRGDWPIKSDKDYAAIQRAYERNDFSGRGSAEVATLERLFSEKHDSMYATAVNSGTAALHAALIALDIQPGDEVLVPNLTFVATAVAVLHSLAIPVLACGDFGEIHCACLVLPGVSPVEYTDCYDRVAFSES